MPILSKYIDREVSVRNLFKDFNSFVLNGYSFSNVIDGIDEFDVIKILINELGKDILTNKKISELIKVKWNNTQVSTYFTNEVLEDMVQFFKNFKESKRGRLNANNIPIFTYGYFTNMFDTKNFIFDNNHTEIFGHYLRVLENGGFDKLKEAVSYEIDENTIKEAEELGILDLPFWYLVVFVLSIYKKEIGVPVLAIITSTDI